ncbi:MAG TPA: response regulator [Candidatus Saccharimonadales bacterium]
MANQKKVLIVEDEKPLSHALTLKLTNEGFVVTTAQNGQECLDAVKKGHFDIILLDLMMPVMDGFQVLQKLKEFGPMPYVIVLSNLSQREDEERVLSLGAQKYFIKSNTPLAVIVDEVKKA